LTASALRPISISKIAKTIFRVEKLERFHLNRALQRLEQHGLVKRQKRDNGNEYLLLTESGKRTYELEKRRMLALETPEVWDKKWRVVLFDIKEHKNNVRDAVRRHLRRDLKFFPLQKSVFATPFPCESEIDFLQRFYKAESEI